MHFVNAYVLITGSEIGTLTYRSGPEWNTRFARKKTNESETITLCPTFEIENYLNYQGEMFSLKYDPNALLYLSKVRFFVFFNY